MNNKKRSWVIALLVVSIFLLCITLLETLTTDNHFSSTFFDIIDSFDIIAVCISLAGAIIALYELLISKKLSMLYKEIDEVESPEIRKLNKLLEYSKKRKEIEQEITKLTNELSHSSVSEYVDLNRLIFAGQSGHIGNGAIDYNQFLSQFGLSKEKIHVKKDYAVFLTPFNSSSSKTFKTCSAILNGMGILLQRTDNVVDKNDIMMNIVSQIVQAEFLIVNIDGRNPNVYYELGIAHAIGKPTILISQVDYPDDSIGFDIRQKQIILYTSDDELEKELLYHIAKLRN